MNDSMKEKYPDTYHDVYDKTMLGFWLYLVTDFMLFATYFAVYVVLVKNTFGGPGPSELFCLPMVLVQTLILITCSFTSGIGGIFAHRRNKAGVIALFSVTFALGLLFTVMQFCDYSRLIASGNSWHRSAFLTAYFNLLGLHTLHMILAMLWVILLIIPVCKQGITDLSLKRLSCLRMFWQFITVVWIFIFSIVYLIGA
ncbi:cytochrome o ubiquinol oxidase subunit III [Candidatus Aerophobetes bacterium]|uniref:Cytochrome o ubiquinol oxidase subunit III n=1 Tax=Aerophobetes bacterium TaxID=2030807 RepID=A0A2A4YCB7_UNCAE|nr:MAG: cytochrome o ubiquinol oxidase subunit III [Candidatus Aerophobetes bacterium]